LNVSPLQIINNQNLSNTYTALCGKELPDTIFVGSSHITIRFKSDEHYTYTGFMVKYKVGIPEGTFIGTLLL